VRSVDGWRGENRFVGVFVSAVDMVRGSIGGEVLDTDFTFLDGRFEVAL
jgi:hypothetical protein